MIEIVVLVLVTILLILVSLSLFFIRGIYIKIGKIHKIISFNSIEFEKINKLANGKDSPFRKIEQKINGMHTVISTHLVKGLLKDKEEE